MKVDPNEARRMLVALLSDPSDKPIFANKLNFDGFTHTQLNFIAATCSATTMLWMLCCTARGNYAAALEGLQSCNLKGMLKELCEVYQASKSELH
jgi:hypothetical protein